MALILSVGSISTVLGFLPSITNTIYYLILILCFIIILTQCNRIKNFNIIILLLTCFISIPLSSYYQIFHSYERLIAFTILLIVVTSTLKSNFNDTFRYLLLRNLLLLCVGVTSVSFICYFFQINFARVSTDSLVFENTHFGGITSHSMILAPLSAISALYTLYKLLDGKDSLSKWQLWALFIAFVISFLTCLIAASRAALFALIVSAVFVTFKLLSNKYFVKLWSVAGIILLLSFPLWKDFTYRLNNKMDYNMSQGGILYSRIDKWEFRLKEFKEHPLMGIGFAQVDPFIGDKYDKKTGNIEPGTSWGASLSMTGILGFFSLLYIIIGNFFKKYHFRTKESYFLCGLIIFFSIHMFFEGYVYSSGSILCLLMWLVVTFDNNFKTNKLWL